MGPAVAWFVALLLAGCGGVKAEIPEDGKDVRFWSGDFELVGDLQLPAGGGPHPAVVMVHGDGSQSRTGNGGYVPIMGRFLDAGYAVFSWDKPGTGASKGEFDSGEKLTQRAEILADAVTVLTQHGSIDPERIGVWGISQAGWVIPIAMTRTDRLAFMIVVSGGGEDGTRQMGYLIGSQMLCAGHAEEEAAQADASFIQYAAATSYEQYREAMEYLIQFPTARTYVGSEVQSEENWNPWPGDSDAFFDPIDVIEEVTIPVLAFFGARDTNVDPVQGAEAYAKALDAAGNEDHRIVVIPEVGHVMTPADTGCIGESTGGSYVAEYLDTMEDWLRRQAGF